MSQEARSSAHCPAQEATAVLWMTPRTLIRMAATAQVDGLPMLGSFGPERDVELRRSELEVLLDELQRLSDNHPEDRALVRQVDRCRRYFTTALADGRTVTLSWQHDGDQGRRRLPQMPRLSPRGELVVLSVATMLAMLTVLLAVVAVSAPVQAYVELLLE